MFKNQLIMAMAIGVFVSLSGIKVPLAIQSLVDTLARANTSIGMIIVGVTLSAYPLKLMFENKLAWIIAALRLGVIPVFTLIIFKMFNMQLELAQIAVVTLGLPVLPLHQY